ncbi:MAG: hypothetical protein RMJ15_04235 [Nitrososphaerota archaeon]|nr:hypothetical protein [Candidatus Bathyarchaeota archaeon]MDW8022931.1 hypothetical protein [Nitrososphaerota archaeon]
MLEGVPVGFSPQFRHLKSFSSVAVLFEQHLGQVLDVPCSLISITIHPH